MKMRQRLKEVDQLIEVVKNIEKCSICMDNYQRTSKNEQRGMWGDSFFSELCWGGVGGAW